MCWENIHNAIPRKRESVVDGRCYELTDYEKDSLKQIELIVRSGYNDRQVLREHLEYLVHLLSRLQGIIDCERSVAAPTISLEREIQRIRDLYMLVEKAKSESEK